ncbi:MAG: spermidine/putrescine ABC transporter ATP-binding protein PotA [Proteobacteria bacterium]|nr:spermidine/putrescine ABC transporter ATP-binding protein PotA [Pseudomonadota bacterium]
MKAERMSNNIIELIDVSKNFRGHEVLKTINLEVRNGEFLTLLGPSGCGKTTLLRLISGFEDPSTGQIYIGNKDVIGLAPHKRDVHTVFQSYALFPHMTVYDNVAFGLRCHGYAESEIKTRVTDSLKMVKLQDYAHRKPEELSGGQQQRIAIARAVVNQPLVLLLDEPLSSLDYKLRKSMQIELKQLQRSLGITFIFVTHDQKEALSISDRVVVLYEGEIQQVGTPREVYEEPKNLTVAKFIGEVNIFDSEVVATTENAMTIQIDGVQRTLNNTKGFKTNDKVHILVRPEDLRVWDQSEVTAAETQDMFPGVVEEAIYQGSTVDLIVRLKSNQLLSSTEFFDEDDDSLQYTLGEPVWVHWLPGWEVILPFEEEVENAQS